jgi:molybdate transport system substrate-binding protein
MTGRRVRFPALAPFLILFLAAGFPACGKGHPVTIYAAASLTDAMEEAADVFGEATGIPMAVRTGGSGLLSLEIQNGAPADVFVAAGEEWLQPLLTRKLLDPETRCLVGWNRLVLVVPNSAVASSPTAFTHLNILETIAVGDPESVPLGRYTFQALSQMGLWLPIQSRLVIGHDARAVLAMVERREVKGAFVYASDARASDKVKVSLEIPEQSHEPIVYVGAVVAASTRAVDAARFLDFLIGPRGKDILRGYGLGGA